MRSGPPLPHPPPWWYKRSKLLSSLKQEIAQIDTISIQNKANTGVLIQGNEHVQLFLSHPIPLQKSFKMLVISLTWDRMFQDRLNVYLWFSHTWHWTSWWEENYLVVLVIPCFQVSLRQICVDRQLLQTSVLLFGKHQCIHLLRLSSVRSFGVFIFSYFWC